MKKYFTFFLCARDWGRVEETVFPFVEKLLGLLPSRGKVQATAQLKGGDGAPASLCGSYPGLLRKLRPGQLSQLILQVGGGTAGVHELFLYFENARYEHTPEYVRFISPAAPERSEAGGALKILSFSIRHDLFEGRLGEAGRSRLRACVEELFAASGCAYGYGRPTAWPVAGPYQFVGDNSPGAACRIAEFDYATQIEGVYEYSYLSESHLRRIEDVGALCGAAGVECRQLPPGRGGARALAVYLQDTSAETLSAVADRLRPLLPTAAAPRKRFYLLLHTPRGGEAVKSALGSYSFAGQLFQLPDFIRVGLRQPAAAGDNREYYAELGEFLGRLHPSFAPGGLPAVERIAQYPGLFDAGEIFQRVPGLGSESPRESGAYAKLFITPDVRLSRLSLLLLFNAGVSGESRAKVGETVGGWLSALARHPEDYGMVSVLEALRPAAFGGREHAAMLVEASGLKQDGLNLLMLIIDDLNRNESSVAYLVCGDLPPGPAAGAVR